MTVLLVTIISERMTEEDIFNDMVEGIEINGGDDNYIYSNVFAETGSAIEIHTGAMRNTITENIFICNGAAITIEPGSNGDKVPPVFDEVLFGQITGTSAPFDIIEVYLYSKNECTHDMCQGRNLLGVAVADGGGNWILPIADPGRIV